MPRVATRATCIAQGTHDGTAWVCSRPAASGGLCEGHRKARQRGRPVMPLRDRPHGPVVALTILLTEEDRAQLGPNPSERAGVLVRAALAAQRRTRRRVSPQLRLGLVPRRRSGASRPPRP